MEGTTRALLGMRSMLGMDALDDCACAGRHELMTMLREHAGLKLVSKIVAMIPMTLKDDAVEPMLVDLRCEVAMVLGSSWDFDCKLKICLL